MTTGTGFLSRSRNFVTSFLTSVHPANIGISAIAIKPCLFILAVLLFPFLVLAGAIHALLVPFFGFWVGYLFDDLLVFEARCGERQYLQPFEGNAFTCNLTDVVCVVFYSFEGVIFPPVLDRTAWPVRKGQQGRSLNSQTVGRSMPPLHFQEGAP